jgi:hypothetical protein
MRAAIRLAILEADHANPQMAKKYGRYGGVFCSFLEAASARLGLEDGELDITLWDIARLKVYPSLEDIDAILITGSRRFLSA